MKRKNFSWGCFFCRVLLTACLLAALVLVSALVQGILPLLPGLLLGAMLLLAVNALCGLLLPAEHEPQRHTVKAKARRVIPASAPSVRRRRLAARPARNARAA